MPTLENAYGLVIGIAHYENIIELPPTVLKDARDVYELLTDPEHCGYSKDNVELLLDDKATQAELRRALAALAARTRADSVVFIYFSGHGGRIESGASAGEYLLTVDTDYESDETLAATSIPGPEFARAVQAIPAQQVVVIFDCCYSAGIKSAKAAPIALKAGLSQGYYDALKSGHGRVVMASSRDNEYSHIMAGAENSLFTEHLLAGLRGGVLSSDGLVRIFNLYEYLQPRVTGGNPNQHPLFRAEVEENFPIAFYVGGRKGVIPTVGDGFRYDAYINYADKEPDSTYVWETLIKRLKDAGLKVAVSDDSEEPGVSRVVGVERAIKQSKRTVIVLSENYLTDNWAAARDTFAQAMGIDEGTYRLLPVKIGQLDDDAIPDRIRSLVVVNLAHPRRAEQQFERLIESLKGPLPQM
jgi:hypothetical protein